MAILVYLLIRYCYCFLSGLKCTFSCIVQYSLYINMNRGTRGHYTLVSSTPSQSTGLVLGCAFFWCWVSLGAPVTISLIELYFLMIFITIVVTIIGIVMANDYFLNFNLGFLYLSSSGSANVQMFPPLDILLTYWIEHVTCGLLYVIFTFPNRIFYSSRLCNWLSLRRLVPWTNICLLYVGHLYRHLIVGCKFDIKESNFFVVLICFTS